MPDLHESDPTLDQAAREQQLPSLRRVPVEFTDVRRLPRKVERVRRGGLHPERRLKALDARLERRIAPRRAMPLVERLGEIQLRPLASGVGKWMLQMFE